MCILSCCIMAFVAFGIKNSGPQDEEETGTKKKKTKEFADIDFSAGNSQCDFITDKGCTACED